LSFGGWLDYREWADHGFLPRELDDSSGTPLVKRVPDVPQPESWLPDDPLAPSPLGLHGIPCMAGLQLETLISTVEPVTREQWSGEYDLIRVLCRVPRSVAEISARIHAPIGVTRLLISYGVALGFLIVHNNLSVDGQPPSVESLMRVSHGLRTLT
jgi:hypothetical protein